jgi:hypothetical protein
MVGMMSMLSFFVNAVECMVFTQGTLVYLIYTTFSLFPCELPLERELHDLSIKSASDESSDVRTVRAVAGEREARAARKRGAGGLVASAAVL